MSTRLIQLSVDPDKTTSYSVSLSKQSGTFSYSGIYDALPSLKQIIDIQGLVASVERITPLAGPSEAGHSIEGRMIPLFQREFISVNYPEKEDGEAYYVQDLIAQIASKAGTSINFLATNNPMAAYRFTGRFIDAFSSLAQEACGDLVQQNGAWYVIPKGTSRGTYQIPIADLISCRQSSQSDVMDLLLGIINSLRSLYDELYQILKRKGALDAELAKMINNTEAQVDNSYRSNISMGHISFEFGCTAGKKPTPIPNNILIEGGTWETFTPATGESLNPDNANKKYYQVKPVMANGLPTGDMTGCTSIIGATLLYPISEPSNSSGKYFAKGLIFNLEMTGGGFGGTDFVPWGVTAEYRIVTQYDFDGNPSLVRQLYFGFIPASGLYWGDDNTITGDKRFYRVNLEMAYQPVTVQAWRFSGTIDTSQWAIVKNGVFNGHVGADGIPYSVSETALPPVTEVGDLDGTLMAENIVRDSNGKLVGSVGEIGEVLNLYRESMGTFNPDTRVVASANVIKGFIEGAFEYNPWPGFVPDPPAAAPYNIFMHDYMHLPLGSTADDIENLAETRLNNEIAKLDLEKEVAEAKIECLSAELAKYSASSLLPYVKAATDAWHAFQDTQEGQTSELPQNTQTMIAALETAAAAKDDELILATNLIRAILIDVDISFLYNNTLPVPGNQLTITGSMEGFSQSLDCGIIDSVSFNGYQVTVRAQKHGTR